jgi:hypothetical protein
MIAFTLSVCALCLAVIAWQLHLIVDLLKELFKFSYRFTPTGITISVMDALRIAERNKEVPGKQT